MKKFLLIIPLICAALVACDDDNEVDSYADNLLMTLNTTTLSSGQTLTATITYLDGSTRNESSFALSFKAINTATVLDASGLFSTFPTSATFDPSVGTVTVNFVVGEIDEDYTVRLTATADGHAISDGQRTISLKEEAVAGEDQHTVTLSVTDGSTTIEEGSAFSITATADEAPEADLTITVDVDTEYSSYVTTLPATITIAAGATSGVSDELTMVDDGGIVNDDITIKFTGTASDENYLVSSLSVTRTDPDVYVDPTMLSETYVYTNPDGAFYSSTLQSLYTACSAYDSSKDVLMTKYDYTNDVDGSAHPNSTLAAEGWTLLNACEFHPVGNGWSYPRAAENTYGLHPVAVAQGWGAQNTAAVEVRSFVDNSKYTNVTDEGILRMWSCLDNGTAAAGGARYCGTSAIYANKGGNYICTNTFIGEGTRVEIRARLAGELVGFLPALWLQGNYQDLTWPEYGEIDIMENHPYEDDEDSWGTMYQTLHWGTVTDGESPTHANPSVENVIDGDAWNIYWCEILADGTVKMGINGYTTKEFSTSDNPTNHSFTWPFTNDFNPNGFHILVTQGVAWNASSMSDADLQAGKFGSETFQNMSYEESKTSDDAPRIEIDWIRYWKNDDYEYADGFLGAAAGNAKMF